MPMDLPPAVVAWPTTTPIGVVLQIHGGGWLDQAGDEQRELDHVKARWTRRGWAVYSTRYQPLGASFGSVLRVYDHIRERWPNARIVLSGRSAGGHLALMIASRRKAYATIVEGAPTLLYSKRLPAYSYDLARLAWGIDRLRERSPARLSLKVPARRVLLTNSECDPLVPVSQLERYKRAHPGVRTYAVPCGRDREYTHAFTTQGGIDRVYLYERLALRK